MATGLYPGIGQPLYLASSNAQEPAWTGTPSAYTPTIPSGSYSLALPLNAGITTSLNVLYGTAPSGTAFEIYYSITPDFADSFALDTVAAVALQKTYVWSTAEVIELDGFIRIKNTGSQDITHAYGQQRATFSD